MTYAACTVALVLLSAVMHHMAFAAHHNQTYWSWLVSCYVATYVWSADIKFSVLCLLESIRCCSTSFIVH